MPAFSKRNKDNHNKLLVNPAVCVLVLRRGKPFESMVKGADTEPEDLIPAVTGLMVDQTGQWCFLLFYFGCCCCLFFACVKPSIAQGSLLDLHPGITPGTTQKTI